MVPKDNLLAIDLAAPDRGPDAADYEVASTCSMLLALLLRLALADGFLRS